MKKTIRIAVAAEANGDWNSCGYSHNGATETDDELMGIAAEVMTGTINEYFIEAEIDFPDDPKTIIGIVKKAE